MRKIDKAIIHCSDSPYGNAELINNWHIKGNGWPEIGYHYVILNGYLKNTSNFEERLDGLMETARDIRWAGAHVYGQNARSIGICLVGRDSFSKQQIKSLKKLLADLDERFRFGDEIYYHRDFDKKKTCPNLDDSVKDDIKNYIRGRKYIE